MQHARWTPERAGEWYRAQPWLCGFNYITSSAINTTAMWQRDSFDPQTIDRELGWAAQIGFTTCRVFVHYLVWEADSDGLLARLDQFLAIAARHGLAVMPCVFDDCAFSGKQSYLVPQDPPAPGVHNSGWTLSPGHARVTDQATWPQLEAYTRSSIGRFGADTRAAVGSVQRTGQCCHGRPQPATARRDVRLGARCAAAAAAHRRHLAR